MSRMRGGLMIHKLLREMFIIMRILTSSRNSSYPNDDHDDESSLAEDLPDDVKEGHFVVHTVDDGVMKRFILELDYLAQLGFLKFLEQAEEEFGFTSEGALVIPCRPYVLQEIHGTMKEEKQ